ncbi:hypothetical protein PM8797T_15853 [Gimesia maris DSM 8797]|nr:hypothetical protein PM8797T_15853 [Gimesia maris DSM 8797]
MRYSRNSLNALLLSPAMICSLFRVVFPNSVDRRPTQFPNQKSARKCSGPPATASIFLYPYVSKKHAG